MVEYGKMVIREYTESTLIIEPFMLVKSTPELDRLEVFS